MTEIKAPTFASSIRWQSANVILQVLVQLVFVFVLARLISKSDFGVMAIALVVVGVIEMFAQIGIGPALVQRSDLSHRHVRAAFYFSIGLGVVFFGTVFVAAPAIGTWFESIELVQVLRWIALSFILSSVALIPRSLLVREMAFERLFWSSAVAMIIGNLIVGLGLAYAGWGLWAYVAALLSQNALLGLMYWLLWSKNGMRMLGEWSRSDLTVMLAYGGRATVFNLLTYAASKADTLVVGHGSPSATNVQDRFTTTGLYDRSAWLMSLPITIMGKLGDSVLFSGMSAIQTDSRGLNRVVLRAITLVAWITLPGSVFLAMNAREVAVLFLGLEYADAEPVVRLLFLGVAFRSMIKIGDAAVRAVDQLNTAIIIKACFLALLGSGSWWSLQGGHGVEGVAAVVTGLTMLQWAVFGGWLFPKMKWDIGAAGTSLMPGIQATVIAASGILVIQWLFIHLNSPYVDWLSLGCCGLWTIVSMFIFMLRHPSMVDGDDPELRAKWMRYLPKSLQTWVKN